MEIEIAEPPASIGFQHPHESEKRVEEALQSSFDMPVMVSIRPEDTLRSGETLVFIIFGGYPGETLMGSEPTHLDKWKLARDLCDQISFETAINAEKIDVDVSVPSDPV